MDSALFLAIVVVVTVFTAPISYARVAVQTDRRYRR
jgi:hypothetical protein